MKAFNPATFAAEAEAQAVEVAYNKVVDKTKINTATHKKIKNVLGGDSKPSAGKQLNYCPTKELKVV